MKMEKNAPAEKVNRKLYKGIFDTFVREGFNLYILVNKLANTSSEAAKRLKNMLELLSREKMLNAYEFYRSNTGCIEAVIEGKLRKVYFPIKPICRFLSYESKESFMEEVDRTSP